MPATAGDVASATTHLPARAVWPLTAGISAAMLAVRIAFALSEQWAEGERLTVGAVAFEEVAGAVVAVPYLYLTLQVLRRWPATAGARAPWLLRLAALFAVASLMHAPLLFAFRASMALALGIDGYSFVPSVAEWVNESINDVLPAVATIAGVTAFEYLQESRERERRAFALQRSLLEAELRSVRLQLQPHFLFNALNTIAATMYDDPTAADAQLTALSELLRASLRSTEAQEVPLRDEVALAERYVHLMQARYPGAFRWEVALAPGVDDVLVPSMALQPLVENAVRHGALATRGAGRVRLTARVVDTAAGEALELRLHDDGPGIAVGGTAATEGGTGLSATRTRLALLHGGRAEFLARAAAEGGFEVVMRLPVRRQAAPAGEELATTAASHAING